MLISEKAQKMGTHLLPIKRIREILRKAPTLAVCFSENLATVPKELEIHVASCILVLLALTVSQFMSNGWCKSGQLHNYSYSTGMRLKTGSPSPEACKEVWLRPSLIVGSVRTQTTKGGNYKRKGVSSEFHVSICSVLLKYMYKYFWTVFTQMYTRFITWTALP